MQPPDPEVTLPPRDSDSVDPDAGFLEPDSRLSETTRLSQTRTVVEQHLGRIGDYELLEQIGRGGMGVVYKAKHLQLGRIAAVKLIKSGPLAEDGEIRRLQFGAQMASLLDHPGIVSIFELGEEQGQHFVAMAYIDGQSLWQRVQEVPLPPHEAARLMQRVAEVIQFAHDRGIIHRDLKPQNIMLTRDGEPKVTDFDLAKNRTANSSLTATGQVLGTPSYMPPEQVSGNNDLVGPLADVYSLGATLYCLLCGHAPFQAASPLDTMVQVLELDPVPLRQVNPAIPRDLETICLKCLQKDASRRYGSAGELAADLQRTLNGEMILASQPGLVDHLRFVLQRNRDDVELATWAKILNCFAWIVLIPEILVWLIWAAKLPQPYVWAISVRIPEFLALAGVLWHYRVDWWPPRTPAARAMLSQWVAFFVGCHLVVYVVVVTHFNAHSPWPLGIFAAYPYFAILSGVMWFTLGSGFWGGCYAFGAAFFLLAILIPLASSGSPVEFGCLWSLCLWTTASRLKRLTRRPISS